MTAWRYRVCGLVSWFLVVSTGLPISARPAYQESTKKGRPRLSPAVHLIDAVEADDLKRVEKYLKQGVSVNTLVYLPDSKQSVTPLVDAAIHGNARLVKYLLQHGADVNGPPSRDPEGYYFNGFTALLAAAASGNCESVRLLLKAGAKLSPRGVLGKNALDEAIDASSIDAVKLLYQAGLRITKPDDHLQSLFAHDPDRTSDVCEFLLEHGANANRRFHWQGHQDTGVTVLMYACGASPWDGPRYSLVSVKGAQILLAHGADPNLKDNEGKTALWYALDLQKHSTGLFRPQIDQVITMLKAAGAK